MTHNTMSVMAPLLVADPAGRNTEEWRRAWKKFDERLATAKCLGAEAVSVDVWWGLAEKLERQYDWSYFDEILDHIITAGLKWVPIMSLHQCGGNIGDTVNVPLASWVWTKLASKVDSRDVNAVKYVSEQGNSSPEYVSCWATDLVLEDYRAFFAAFQTHFASKAGHIAEINISLGPAGELRYPSYNSHDKGTDYPTRGALQCYSELARKSFVDFVITRYGSRDGVRQAWGEFENIEPPRDVEAFFAHKVHTDTQYGRDLFDWYTQSLHEHGRKVMTAALDTFSADGAPFAGIDLGAKVPGVHWRMGHWEGDRLVLSDRLAELNAGLIRTSDWNSGESHGYSAIVGLFRDFQFIKPGTRVVLHFTCLEMADGENESLAYQLVRWVGAEANRQGVVIKGENALNYTLYNAESWQRLRSAMSLYAGLTILRVNDIVDNDVARREFLVTARLAAATESPASITVVKQNLTTVVRWQPVNPLLLLLQAAGLRQAAAGM
jgi:beta-amylase